MQIMVMEVSVITRHQGEFTTMPGYTAADIREGLAHGNYRMEHRAGAVSVVVLNVEGDAVAYCEELTASTDAPGFKYIPT